MRHAKPTWTRITLAALAALLAAPAGATTITVTTIVDDASNTPNGNCTFREAVKASNTNAVVDACPAGEANPIVDKVVVGPGWYQMSPSRFGAGENAADLGDYDLLGDVEIAGAGAATTSLTGPPLLNADRIFHVQPGATVHIHDVTIAGGIATIAAAGDQGGGGVHNAGNLTLERVVVEGNDIAGGSAGVGVGGGVMNVGTLRVVDSTIRDNRATDGAGLLSAATSTLTIETSTVSSNQSYTGTGAGLYLQGLATLVNTTIAGNSGPIDGVQINTSRPLILTNVTVKQSSGTSRAVQFTGSAQVRASNTLIQGGCVFLSSSWLVSDGGNLESTGNTCRFIHANDQVNVANPRLGALKSYGGPTATVSLQVGSPAVNAGLSAFCPAVDQRGMARSDGACDVGAYESGVCTDADGDLHAVEGGGCSDKVDCDDTSASVFPGAPETCNNRDDDCDATVDEGFDVDHDGYSKCALPVSDCNDANAAVNPGAAEVPNNGIDDNCDGCNLDGACSAGESCTNCGADCVSGSTPGAVCGNGICEDGNGESCSTCAADCNGLTTGKPKQQYCCGAQTPCSDARCNANGKSCTTVPTVPQTFCCGDSMCSIGEGCGNCALDCTVGSEVCTGGLDENCNGQIDCGDSACSATPTCTPTCQPLGSSCTTSSQCCSLNCGGPKNRKTCR